MLYNLESYICNERKFYAGGGSGSVEERFPSRMFARLARKARQTFAVVFCYWFGGGRRRAVLCASSAAAVAAAGAHFPRYTSALSAIGALIVQGNFLARKDALSTTIDPPRRIRTPLIS